MRPFVHACSNRVPWSACLSHSAIRLCGRRSMPHYRVAERSATLLYPRLSSVSDHETRSAPMSHATPIVFVVDDDVSVRESLELLIRWAGWQPETFASAQEFLSRPRVLAPSCLVLDVGLPDLNGLDLQKRVAVDRADMPIIFITAKPFGDDVLLSAIQ